ncbi:MAG TPA: YbjQ family protein [Gemmataceae bacterium]|nr:YbjQ family protein [Gemmataceae bacterium]
MPHQLIVTTGDTVDGYRIRAYLGVVRGIAVRAPTPRQGFQALGKVLSGNFQGSWEMYEEVCEAAREDAFRRMVRHAEERHADAIVAMRYDATDVAEGVTEVLAYGTAVQLHLPEAQPAAGA